MKKYVCPYCLKVLAIGVLHGRIKCKKCGKLVDLTGEYKRVQPTDNARASAR